MITTRMTTTIYRCYGGSDEEFTKDKGAVVEGCGRLGSDALGELTTVGETVLSYEELSLNVAMTRWRSSRVAQPEK
jgi:hypothetical protein